MASNPTPPPIDLQALREALDRMSPRPWRVHESEADMDPRQAGWWSVFAGSDTTIADTHRNGANAAGIVALVNAALPMLDRIAELENALTKATN